MANSYQDLVAWKKAVEFVTEIYRATKRFPKEENYGLTSQIRRAAISIPSNIAEGQGRLTKGEFKQFLGNARGSLFELVTQLTIAENLGYMNKNDFNGLFSLSDELGRLLNGLLTSLRKN
jgi:four helix bundle protein